MFGPGMFLDSMGNVPFVPPTVTHFQNESSPDPNAVRVGHGSCMATLTPWSCPLLPEHYSAVEARLIISERADVESWLARLTGKVLVCNCRCPPYECWAEILRSEFVERYEGVMEDDEDQTFDVDGADLDVREELEVDKLLPGNDAIGRPEALSGIPKHTPWPDSWIRLVRSIRSLKRPSFWEIFSGRAVLTDAFRALGVKCAPPIDAAIDPDYNLLNSAFLTVAVGVLPRGPTKITF